MPTETEVVVVGGGPAGTTTAHWLARAGIRVTLLDRARFPRPKPCAEYLSPQCSRSLDAMGLLGTVERSGAAQLTGMRLRAPDGTTFEGRFLAEHGYRGFRDRGLALPRLELDALLLDGARAAGVEVIEGWRVRGLACEANGRVIGVVGTDASGAAASIRSRVVVGADGLRSAVARELGLARRSRFPERYAFVAHYSGVQGIGTEGEMHVAEDGYVGFADVGRGRTNVALVVPAGQVATEREGAVRLMSGWIARHPHLARRFAPATRITPVRATGPFASHARRAWAPGAALVGDAADFFDPFTGEGIYSALRGGELLAPFIAAAVRAGDARDADAALAAYARAHAQEFRGKRLVEKLIGIAVAHPAIFNRAARALARRSELADLLVGVAGDFVPASEVLRARFIFDLFGPALR